MGIRLIEKKDNKAVEDLIRFCLIEYGGNHEGTAWCDPYLGCFYEVYQAERSAYWVYEDEDGVVQGGVGIGPLENDICELQKMYTYPKIRGTGIAKELLDTAIQFAKQYYKKCYIETLDNMVEAQSFYKKNGFNLVDDAIGSTGHNRCQIKLLKDL